MVNLNYFKTFCVVAKEKNISKASEILFMSQPAVSFSIKELEKALGQKLFVRKSKGVELTSFGELLYDKVHQSLENLEKAEEFSEKFSKLSEGVLRIGSSSSNANQVILKYLSQFVKKYPDIQISMKRGNLKTLTEDLKENNIDIIFVDNFNISKDFKLLKKFDVKYELIGNKQYKEKYPASDVELSNFPAGDLILPSENNNSRLAINTFFEKHNISFSPKYELDNYILLYEFVKSGFGIAFVNIDYYKDAVQSGEVEVIFPNFSICAREIVCLMGSTSTNPAAYKFAEIISEDK